MAGAETKPQVLKKKKKNIHVPQEMNTMLRFELSERTFPNANE
jgi:hypothetical protein